MKLVITNKGRRIHKPHCVQLLRCKTRPIPWTWAEDKNEAIIAAVAVQLRREPCIHCRPIRWR